MRLDYAFTPAAFAARVLACGVGTGYAGAPQASDRFPLLLLSVLDAG